MLRKKHATSRFHKWMEQMGYEPLNSRIWVSGILFFWCDDNGVVWRKKGPLIESLGKMPNRFAIFFAMVAIDA